MKYLFSCAWARGHSVEHVQAQVYAAIAGAEGALAAACIGFAVVVVAAAVAARVHTHQILHTCGTLSAERH